MKKDKPYKLLTVQPGKFGNQRDMPYCRRKTERGRLPLPVFPLSWGGCGYTSASLVSVLSGCPYQGGFRKKVTDTRLIILPIEKRGWRCMRVLPSTQSIHLFVWPSFPQFSLSVPPSSLSVPPSLRSVNQHKLRLKKSFCRWKTYEVNCYLGRYIVRVANRHFDITAFCRVAKLPLIIHFILSNPSNNFSLSV